MHDKPNRRQFLQKAATLMVAATGGSLAAESGSGAAGDVPRELAAARQWFSDSVFNLAMDYWTFVPYRPYGSGCTPENILPVLSELRPGFLLVYAKGETGHTSFRSSLGSAHPMLARDLPPLFRELTHKTGTRLFLYWSGLEDGVAGKRHPEWALLDASGQPFRNFANLLPSEMSCTGMCPQGPFFDEWVTVQLRQVFKMADPDGMWIDGTWMPPCYCPRCVARFRKETGYQGAVPSGWDWIRYWAKVLFEFRRKFLVFLRSLKPQCLVSFGNISVRREFREDRDWCSGDWYSPNQHRLAQSLAMRRYATTGLPAEAWICDTQVIHSMPDFRPRTKSLSRILQEGAGILANGGTWTYWTFPLGNGAFVPHRMRLAKKAADWARKRAHVCLGTRSAAWTAIMEMEPKNLWFDEDVWGAGKAMLALHRSPDLIEEADFSEKLPYDLVVVPEQAVVTPEAVIKFEAFVRRGGKLLSTGVSAASVEMQRLLGVKLADRGVVEEGHVLLKSGDPVGVFAPWDKLELHGAETLYPLYHSWDHGNTKMRGMPKNLAIVGLMDEERPVQAGMPAATLRRLGKGVAVHVPTELFTIYWRYGYPSILAWLREVFDAIQPEPLFRTDAFSYVEVALRLRGDDLLVHLVNGCGGRDLSYVGTKDLWVDEIPPLGPITCWIRCFERPGSCTWEPGSQPADVSWHEGVLKAVLPRLEIHACLQIRRWKRPA